MTGEADRKSISASRPPERRRGRPPRTAGPAARDLLLETARHVFARKGYDGATLEEIVTTVGVGAPTLYHHFGGKENLFIAVAHAAFAEVLEELDHVAAAGTGAEQIQAVLRAGTAMVERDPDLVALLHAIPIEMARHPELAHAHDGHSAFREVLERAVRLGTADGSLPEVADPAALAALVVTVFAGLTASAITMAPDEYKQRAAMIDSMFGAGGLVSSAARGPAT